MISDIEVFKYLQVAGEYTLKATVVNVQDVTTQWSCDGNAVMYEIPYSVDTSFVDIRIFILIPCFLYKNSIFVRYIHKLNMKEV